jgi:hypothetical protein
MVSSSLNTDPSLNTFNVYAYERSATLVFQDGREVDARNITASPDSTRFLNEKTDAVVWAVLLFGGAPGGVIGGIWGEIAGHSYEYQFPTSADCTKK